MSTYTDQIRIHGRTIWLPPMRSTAAATALRAELERILAEERTADLRQALEYLQVHGWAIVWQISGTGGPESDTYSLLARPSTWASKTISRLEAEHKPEALPGVALDSLLTLAQAAQEAGLTRQTILARIQSPDNPLPAYRVGRQYMVSREDLAAWRPKRPGPKAKAE